MAKKQKFITGAIILTLGGIIAKLLGLFFRLPLTRIVGTEGVGLYQIVFPLYALLLVVSTTGIPVAISKLIAEKNGAGDAEGASKIFSVSLKISKKVGWFLSVLVFFIGFILIIFNSGLAGRIGLGYMAISPSIYFVALLSSYRGYFQGVSNMTPTAVTQIIEQAVKVAASLLLAYLLIPFGIEFAVSGALLGITISELVAAASIYFYFRKKVELPEYQKNIEDEKLIAKQVIRLSLPVSIGACVLPLSVFFDSYIAISILQKIGFSESTATSMYGLDAGIVASITNIPIIVSSSLSLALIPIISKCFKQRNYEKANHISSMATKICLWVILPAMALFLVFPEQTVQILYGRGLEKGIANQVQIAGKILACNALVVFLVAFSQLFTSLNQAIGKVREPVFILLAGVLLKIILSVIFLHSPYVNIIGLTFGSLACFGFAFIMNYYVMLENFKLRIKPFREIAIPVFLTIISTVLGLMTYQVLQNRINKNLCFLISIGVIGVIYVISMLLVNRSVIKDFNSRSD